MSTKPVSYTHLDVYKRQLWDSQIYIDDNTLSVNVTRLRGKLEALGVPGMIRTRRGMGYQYDGA